MNGFGLFVIYGGQRREIANTYLDECHEHNHIIGQNESESETCHYNLTNAYAYIVQLLLLLGARAISAQPAKGRISATKALNTWDFIRN